MERGYCYYGRCGVTKREMTEGGVQNIYYAEDRPKSSGGKESHVMEAKNLTPCINVMNAKIPHVINSNEVKTSVTLAITLSIKTSGSNSRNRET
jgi:hypothetical protein